MNMQEIEENNKTQAREQKVQVERFLAALHLLTIQTGIEIFSPDGFMLIESHDQDQEYLTVFAEHVHHRGQQTGYFAPTWHPDLIESEEEGDEYFVEREVENE